MKYRISDYVLRIWVTSILMAPVLLLFMALEKGVSSAFQLFIFTILFGAILSLPCFLLFYLACRFIVPYIGKVFISKAVLSIIGVLLVYAPFLILNDFSPLLDRDKLSQILFITYGAIAVIGILGYPIKQAPEIVEQSETFTI